MKSIAAKCTEIERPVSVPQVARLLDLSPRHTLRLLVAMHAKDRTRSRGGWMWNGGPRTKMRINLSALRIVHPELFETEPPIAELDDRLTNILGDIANSLAELRKQVNAHGSRLRALEDSGQTRTS